MHARPQVTSCHKCLHAFATTLYKTQWMERLHTPNGQVRVCEKHALETLQVVYTFTILLKKGARGTPSFACAKLILQGYYDGMLGRPQECSIGTPWAQGLKGCTTRHMLGSSWHSQGCTVTPIIHYTKPNGWNGYIHPMDKSEYVKNMHLRHSKSYTLSLYC